MTTTFTDNFTRPDEVPISPGLYGGDLLGRPDHRVAVVGHAAIGADYALNNSASCYYLTPTSSADCRSSVTIGVGLAYWETFVRIDSIGPGLNAYALVGFGSHGSGTVSIYRNDGGGGGPLLDTGVTWFDGETWELRATGSTIACYRDGGFINSVPDTTYPNAGFTGFLLGPDGVGGGTNIYQFSAGPFPDVSTIVPGPPPMVGRMNR